LSERQALVGLSPSSFAPPGGFGFPFKEPTFSWTQGRGRWSVASPASRPLDPTHLDGILLSHKHLDHAGDVNALIEAMTEGGYRQRGVLFATEDALESDPVVFRYLRSYVRRIEILKEYQTYHLRDLCFFHRPKAPPFGGDLWSEFFAAPLYGFFYHGYEVLP
jgi:hypothetical protein